MDVLSGPKRESFHGQKRTNYFLGTPFTRLLPARNASCEMLVQRLPRLGLTCHKLSPLSRSSTRYGIPILSRTLVTSQTRLRPSSTSPPPPAQSQMLFPDNIDHYKAPLTNTFRRLKIFSLTSLGLSSTLAPFMFLIEANLPQTARLALAATAIATSSFGTMLIAWVTRPYVVSCRRMTELHGEGNEGLGKGIEVKTLDMFLRPRLTQVSTLHIIPSIVYPEISSPHSYLRYTTQTFWLKLRGRLQHGSWPRKSYYPKVSNAQNLGPKRQWPRPRTGREMSLGAGL